MVVKLTWEILADIDSIFSKGVIRIRKSKNRQHNGQKKKDKKRSTKHIQKTKE